MSRGRTLVALAIAAAFLAAPAGAQAALRWSRCSERSFECTHLKVPLDRAGAVSGSVSLRVARDREFRRRGRQTGVTLLLGADPGESAVEQYAGEYALSEVVDQVRDAPLGNRVVVFDQRGTGGSGALRCRDLQSAAATDLGREAEACATLLGSRRSFYGTSETVADIEALRLALGGFRLTIVASRYGAYVAQQYALAHPGGVDRLVLESPVDAAGLDPLRLDSIAAARRVLPLTCRKACPFTRDPVADTARLVGTMAAKPLRGYVIGSDGRRRAATLTSQELLFTLARGGSSVLSTLDYPAAVVSALRGDRAPLFRLKHRAVEGAGPPDPELSSAATRAAVLCEETRFPWDWRASAGERAAAANATGAGLTADLTRPFGPDAAVRSDLMRLCRRWPAASGPPSEPGAMPDVPVLVMVPDVQIAEPIEVARRVAGRFVHSRLLITPVPLGPALAGSSRCVFRALTRFLRGADAVEGCARRGRPLPVGRPLPTAVDRLRPVRGMPGKPGRVLRAVELTFSEWVSDIYAEIFKSPAGYIEDQQLRGGGLRGGRWAMGRHRVVLDRYEFIPGLRLSGAGRNGGERFTVTVDGPGRLDGRLTVGESDDDDELAYSVRGRLGGRRVRAQLTLEARILDLIGAGSSASRVP